MENQRPWKNNFIGRECELTSLREAFKKSAPKLFDDVRESDEEVAFPEPQIVVIKGEDGVGKSRIVQEFYRTIAVSKDDGGLDPDDYWPDAFGDPDRAETEIVNPEIPTGFTVGKRPPFMWWGVRWYKPSYGHDGHHLELGSHKHLKYLTTHKDGIKRNLQIAYKVAKRSLPLIVKTATLGWVDANSISSAIGAAKEIHGSLKGHDAAKLMEKHDNDLLSEVQQYLQRIIHPPGFRSFRDAATPLVLWLDDSQWMMSDEIKQLNVLIDFAKRNHCPLFIIATYKSSDWNRHNSEATNEDKSAKEEPENFYDLASAFIENSNNANILEVKDGIDFSNSLHEALPGLSSKDHDMLLEKSRGHPALFSDVVTGLLDNPSSFVDDNTEGELKPIIAEDIHERDDPADYFFNKKAKHLNETTRLVLKWSSCQGIRFFQKINNAVAEEYDLNELEVAKSIDIAINPEAIIRRVGTGNQNEFQRSSYREMMLRKCTPGQLRKITNIISQTIEAWIEDKDKFGPLSESEQLDILLLAERHLSPCVDGEILNPESLDFSNSAHIHWIRAKLLRLPITDDSSAALQLAREIMEIDKNISGGIPYGN